MSIFKKATKKESKLRGAFFGPSGSGKTFTALRVATGLGGPIAFIDTERGSASLYASKFEFDVCELVDRTISSYVSTIKAAGGAGYNVLIIDSLSHAWQELLREIDHLAKTKFRGNTWSAWSEGTPKQRMLVDAILTFPGHVIATMRSKTEWVQEQTSSGKTKPVMVGMAPEQGKGIEYEFTFLLELSVDHVGTVLKDRTGEFQDKIITKPGEEFGQALLAWLAEGASMATPEQQETLIDLSIKAKVNIAPVLQKANVTTLASLTEEEASKTITWLEGKLESSPDPAAAAFPYEALPKDEEDFPFDRTDPTPDVVPQLPSPAPPNEPLTLAPEPQEVAQPPSEGHDCPDDPEPSVAVRAIFWKAAQEIGMSVSAFGKCWRENEPLVVGEKLGLSPEEIDAIMIGA